MNTTSTSSALESARELILTPSSLNDSALQAVLGGMLSHQIDAAELYFQLARQESWSLEDQIVKDGSFSVEQGVGVRANSGEKTGFAYSEELALPALQRASQAAKTIARLGQDKRVSAWNSALTKPLYGALDPISSLSDHDKVAFLEYLDSEARRQDPRIKKVMASMAASHEVILVVASDGTFAADVRPLVRVNVMVVAESSGRIERGYAGCGGRFDYQSLMANGKPEQVAKEAVHQALINLEAKPAPAGEMTVVIGAGWPGVLLHEAIGHGLEGDFNRKGTSAFSGRVGEKVANSACTIVDDGTLAERRGSLTIDDEGVPTQCTTLIENGVLKGYLQDKLNARLMNTASTGNGRRESYAHIPMPRMTNTYMLPGETPPEEIIQSVDRGLYAKNFSGGQVDITSGKFVFTAAEAYLIEQGKITSPVKGATLIGDGPKILQEVSMVGNDLELDAGIGICGKEGQSVPVGVGQPTLKIDRITVGGTQG